VEDVFQVDLGLSEHSAAASKEDKNEEEKKS